MTPTREEIAGAVARGWCHPDNEHKVMDEKLAYAIVDEIEALLNPGKWAGAERIERRLGEC